MNALVFAAGLGTRLRPFTLNHPKALVEVGGVPMLQRVLLKLKQAGVARVVVNVHHFADQIMDFLDANGNFGLDLAVSDERARLLDTGGAVLKAAPLLGDEPFIVHNADILTDFPLDEFMRFHNQRANDVSLLVASRKTSRYLYFSHDDRLEGWGNLSTSQFLPEGFVPDADMSQMAFGGVHLISPSVFPLLKDYAGDEEAFPIVPFYISQCRRLKIGGYVPSEPYRWHDIGKPESLAAAENDLRD